MIDYELAKQLKNAGFPQELPDPSSYYDAKERLFGWSEGEDKPYGNAWVKVPTLEELIEACVILKPKREIGLQHNVEAANRTKPTDEWTAYWEGASSDTHFEYGLEVDGSTPIEAVAQLWLALNENKPAS